MPLEVEQRKSHDKGEHVQVIQGLMISLSTVGFLFEDGSVFLPQKICGLAEFRFIVWEPFYLQNIGGIALLSLLNSQK